MCSMQLWLWLWIGLEPRTQCTQTLEQLQQQQWAAMALLVLMAGVMQRVCVEVGWAAQVCFAGAAAGARQAQQWQQQHSMGSCACKLSAGFWGVVALCTRSRRHAVARPVRDVGGPLVDEEHCKGVLPLHTWHSACLAPLLFMVCALKRSTCRSTSTYTCSRGQGVCLSGWCVQSATEDAGGFAAGRVRSLQHQQRQWCVM
jgi:hypothetical protein